MKINAPQIPFRLPLVASRCLTGLALLASALGLTAGTTTWTGAGADAFWTTPGNWTPGAPLADDLLIFGNSAQAAPDNNFPAGTTFGGITFNGNDNSSYTLGGNSIGLLGSVENSSGVAQTLGLPLVITNAVTFNTVSNDSSGISSDLTVSAAISGAGSVLKTGGGILTLGDKSYTGGTTVSNGLVIVNNDNGSYTLAGGALKLTFGSWWSGANYDFTADSSLGVDAGGPDYNSRGRYDSAGRVGSPGFKWTVIGTGRWQFVGGSGHLLAGATEVTAPAVLSDVNGGNSTISGLGTNTITVNNGAALRKNNGGIVLNPLVLQGGAGPDERGILVANQEDYAGQPTTIVATFSNTVTLTADSTLGVQYGSMVIAGSITGAGSLTKIGSYPLTLAASNSYAGNTFITSGNLILGADHALPTGTLLDLGTNTLDLGGFSSAVQNVFIDSFNPGAQVLSSGAGNATLTFGADNNDLTLATPVQNTGSGALGFVKQGTGTATFTSPLSNYRGGIAVQGGTFDTTIPAGAATNGPISVANGTKLTVRVANYGTSFKPSAMTIGAVSGASTVDVDLGSYGNAAGGIFNVTNGTGVFTANGTTTVDVLGDSGAMGVGQFPIFRYTTRAGTGTFVLGALPANIVATIVTNASGKSIDLKVSSAPVTTWVGNVNNLWDISTTINWTGLAGPDVYSDGVGVLFDDTGLTNNVDLTTVVSPAVTTVSSSKNYYFYGAGSLYGGDLVKGGSGKLTLATAFNNYNNTTIGAGTLQVGDGTNANASLGYGTVNDNGVLAFNLAESPATVASTIAGTGSVVKDNTNSLSLTAANSFSGGTVINAGVLALGNATALGIPASGVPLATVASGGGLDINGKLVAATNNLRIAGMGPATNQGSIYNSGAGTYIGGTSIGVNTIVLTADAAIGNDGGMWEVNGAISGNGFNLFKLGNDTVNFRATAVNSPAQVIVGSGGIYFMRANCLGTTATIVLSNNAWMNTWDNNNWSGYTVANNFLIGPGGGQIRNSQGAWYGHANYDTYNGNITLDGTLTLLNTATYSGSPNPAGVVTHGTMVLNGVISGTNGLYCSAAAADGGNIITLNGVNTYTGPTTIANGTLLITTGQRGGGAYTNMDGATLALAIKSGYDSLPMSSLEMGSSAGATLNLTRLTALTTNAPITATNLTAIGVNTIALPPSAAILSSGQFPLIKYTGTLNGGGSFSLASTGRGLGGYISNNVANSSIDYVATAGSPVTWTGISDNVWDTAATANWDYQAAPTTFQSGDAVLFNDSGLQTTVNLSAAVTPSILVVSNAAKNYTFTNSAITGGATLVKTGTGVLTLRNNNSFTGGTLVNGGTVQLGNDGALNNSSGAVTVTGNGAVDLNGYNPQNVTFTVSGAGFGSNGTIVAMANGAYNKSPGAIVLAGDASIGGATRWDLRNGLNRLDTPTNAYTLTKVGANQISLVGTKVSANLGDIKIMGGNLGLELSSGCGDTNKTIYVYSGGIFSLYQSSVPVTKPIVVYNGGYVGSTGGGYNANQNVILAPMYLTSGTCNVKLNYGGGVNFSNIISGPANLWVEWNGDALFAGVNTFTGDFETQGRVKLVGNGVISSTNNVTINNGGSGSLTVQDNAVVNGQNLRIYNGVGSGALVVRGNGTINSKTIQVGNAFADWSGRTDGMLTLQSGQTLRLDNGGRVKGNVVAASGSTFSPGGSYNIQNTGILTNALTLQVGSTTYMDVNLNGGVTNNDSVTVLGALTYGGSLVINNNGTNALVAGTTFKLFTGGSYSGAFATISTNTGGQFVTWDTSQLLVNGTLTVASATASSRPTLTNSVADGSLNLNWPSSHLGWTLQTNAVDVASPSDWHPYPGSQSVTNLALPVDAAKAHVFFRLTYP